MRIAVHAGHNPAGKVACGAVGIAEESKVNRIIKDHLIDKLLACGYDVIDTTVEDGTSASQILQELKARTDAANPMVSISIHLNAFDGTANGVEAYYYTGNNDTKALCTQVTDKISTYMGIRDRGAKAGSKLYVIHNFKCPSILIECWFCDSVIDFEQCNGKEERIACAITDAIYTHYGAPASNPEAPVTPGKLYRVQVGAFTDKGNAQRLLKQIEAAGFPGYVKESDE